MAAPSEGGPSTVDVICVPAWSYIAVVRYCNTCMSVACYKASVFNSHAPTTANADCDSKLHFESFMYPNCFTNLFLQNVKICAFINK